MYNQLKLAGVTALIAGLSTGAIAQSTVTAPVPESAQGTMAAEANNTTSVETYTEEKPLAKSAQGTMAAESGATTSTEIESTASLDKLPDSLKGSRLAESTDLEQMADSSGMQITPMSEGIIAWDDAESSEMRAAILANTMVKDALEAEGYSESDVVAAYTRADGGLTLVVDG